jgi:hypothetical protein
MDKLETVTMATADKFFSELREQMNENISQVHKTYIFRQLSIFIYHNRSIVAAFLASDLLASMDFTSEELFEVNLRLVICGMSHDIKFIVFEIARALAHFATVPARARCLLKFWAIFISQCEVHPDSGSILQLFIKSRHFYLFSSQTVDLFFSLYTRTRYADLRPDILTVFQAGVNSPNAEVVRACYQVFCHIKCDIRDLPLVTIVASMTYEPFETEGMEILGRLRFLPTSTRLVAAVLLVGERSPFSVFVLCCLAGSPEGANLLAQNQGWLIKPIFNVADSLLLLLSVCQHVAVRNALTGLRALPLFLTRIAAEGSAQALHAIMSLLLHTQIPPQFVLNLEADGFFRTFFWRTLQSPDLHVKNVAILLTDKLARVTWIQAFVQFIQYIPMLFELVQLHQTTFTATLVLSVHPQAKDLLVSLGIQNLLPTLTLGPALDEYRPRLLQVLSECKKCDFGQPS